jgi:hypothetical protein
MESKTKKEEQVPFWGEDPNVILDFKYITELYPSDTMTPSQKLNAITRSVIILTIVGSFFTSPFRLWIISLITLAAVWYLHYHQTTTKRVKFEDEAFTNKDDVKKVIERKELPQDIFSNPQSNNPFGNTLLTDYDKADQKKPAPPSYNKRINDKIVSQTKQTILDNNPEQPHITNRLFSGLDDDLAFEQSMRPFYTMPNTTIPNDQNAFAEFCYGSMISCKEGNEFACARNMTRHTNI